METSLAQRERWDDRERKFLFDYSIQATGACEMPPTWSKTWWFYVGKTSTLHGKILSSFAHRQTSSMTMMMKIFFYIFHSFSHLSKNFLIFIFIFLACSRFFLSTCRGINSNISSHPLQNKINISFYFYFDLLVFVHCDFTAASQIHKKYQTRRDFSKSLVKSSKMTECRCKIYDYSQSKTSGSFSSHESTSFTQIQQSLNWLTIRSRQKIVRWKKVLCRRGKSSAAASASFIPNIRWPSDPILCVIPLSSHFPYRCFLIVVIGRWMANIMRFISFPVAEMKTRKLQKDAEMNKIKSYET